MQYHPSMHPADHSMADQIDANMSLGAASVPPNPTRPVAMPANFISAAVPHMYRDYTSVDSLNTQASLANSV